ncbi:MAG: hypothetical protein NZ928_01325 [Endomicrobia bacterium]|nr:hypothetical protein [Endomicrobiia bacterium]
MSDKKQKKVVATQVQQKTPTDGISKTGWKIILLGVVGLVIGFILLSFTNPEGNNWASVVSPTVIILSYVTIALGIIAR